jgi:ATP-dependent exoDNAse (exonuclease V) beta subunit
MPGCSKAKHPSGVEIAFTEDDHRYASVVNGKEIEYTSGTTFVHKFFPEFDPDGKILERCALREGKTPAQLKKEWDDNRDASCLFGTRVHAICEDVLLARERRFKPKDDRERGTFERGAEMANLFRQKLDVLGVEKIVFSPYLPRPIAGTVDLLARSRKDGSILILDWKTNKSIDRENRWNKFGLDPIRHVPDLNYWHYSLQLSLYQYLLTFGKYVPEGSKFKRAIIHLTETGHEIIQLPDLTSEIKDMVIWDACRF